MALAKLRGMGDEADAKRRASKRSQRSSGARVARKGAARQETAANKAGRKGVVLLSGGNPQIAKGEGEGPVRAWIEAAPEGKRELCERLDALVTKTVPRVRKAVKWNSPFYGVEGQGWFLAMHIFTRYVKVGFFKGVTLKPLPPGGTKKSGEMRWIDLHDGEGVDEAQLVRWIRQAARIPGWMSGL
jgi:hypothetical protein